MGVGFTSWQPLVTRHSSLAWPRSSVARLRSANRQSSIVNPMKRLTPWPWLWFLIGAIYFFVPLLATFQFSLQAKRGELGFSAYANVLNSPEFFNSFLFSMQAAVTTIVVSALLVVPTAYWVELRLPKLRPVVEFVTLLPFVVPAVVLVFGLARTYNRTPLTDSREGLYVLLVGGYVIL
ncbi:MAG: hypothetical protein MUD01_19205, partial [Chloroflexaceae bacterium]|nr:hypothetical protein [Chloroflexaceae bacterium]